MLAVENESFFLIRKEKDTKKVRLEDITTIGKDIVLVGKKSGNNDLSLICISLGWYNESERLMKSSD